MKITLRLLAILSLALPGCKPVSIPLVDEYGECIDPPAWLFTEFTLTGGTTDDGPSPWVGLCEAETVRLVYDSNEFKWLHTNGAAAMTCENGSIAIIDEPQAAFTSWVYDWCEASEIVLSGTVTFHELDGTAVATCDYSITTDFSTNYEGDVIYAGDVLSVSETNFWGTDCNGIFIQATHL